FAVPRSAPHCRDDHVRERRVSQGRLRAPRPCERGDYHGSLRTRHSWPAAGDRGAARWYATRGFRPAGGAAGNRAARGGTGGGGNGAIGVGMVEGGRTNTRVGPPS